MKTIRIACLMFICFLLSVTLLADEGMWLLNDPPRKELADQYKFNLSDQFLELLQFSSVRFSTGGSGSFVSPDGLVMTNHHIAVPSLAKISSPEKDYLKTGFYAPGRTEEIAVPDLELVMLMGIEDVTGYVRASVTAGMEPGEAQEARRGVINEMEKKAAEKTGYKCDVVTLYQGGAFHLYYYKKFDDVRIVFAPEEAIGFFGGEPDNFEYPRYCLDVSFFRVYEGGKPYAPPRYLKWNESGVKEGELVFVSGHPGRTNRLETSDHLLFRRDVLFPYSLNRIRRQEILLQIYSEKSPEHLRRVAAELFRVRNTRKNLTGVLLGLQTPINIENRLEEETDLYDLAVEEKLIDPDKENPWYDIAQTVVVFDEIYSVYELIENGHAFHSDLYRIARNIVRLANETEKPNNKRLREFQESALPLMKKTILSPAPIYKDLEVEKLTDSLGMYLELIPDWEYGDEEQDGLELVGEFSPRERAGQLIRETKLDDLTVRQKLIDGGITAVTASGDPMIQFARKVEEIAGEIRSAYESEVAEPLQRGYEQVAAIRSKLTPGTSYPDATFTLRLSYGQVASYQEDDGTKRPAWTTLGGIYQHAQEHQSTDPFQLPPSWLEARDKLELATPFNIISTNDIIGGNSGSPLINSRGEVIGVIFDGNVQSLCSNFVYSDNQSRALSVHSQGIIEALKKIYKAMPLVNELTAPKPAM